MTFRLATAALALASLAACAKANDAPQEPPVDYVGEARKALKGTWQSACAEGENLTLLTKANLGITKLSRIELNGDSVKEVAYITSSSCEGKDIEVIVNGKIDLNEVKAVDAGKAKILVAEYRVKPLSEFGVRILNISKWCGINDWMIDQERDVSAEIGKEKCFSAIGTETTFSVKKDSVSFEVPSFLQSATATKPKVEFKRIDTGAPAPTPANTNNAG